MNPRLLYLGTTAALLALSACMQSPPISTTTDGGRVEAPPREPLPAAPMSQDNPAAPVAPTATPTVPGDDTYLRADTNNDGRVSAEEWNAARRGGSAGSSVPR
jgi:hypothetical protein